MVSINSKDEIMKKLDEAYLTTMIIEYNIRRIGFEISKEIYSNDPIQIVPEWYEIKFEQIDKMTKDIKKLLIDVAKSQKSGKHSVN